MAGSLTGVDSLVSPLPFVSGVVSGVMPRICFGSCGVFVFIGWWCWWYFYWWFTGGLNSPIGEQQQVMSNNDDDGLTDDGAEQVYNHDGLLVWSGCSFVG